MVFLFKKSNIFLKLLLVGFLILAIYIGNVVFFPHTIPGGQYQIVVEKNHSISALALKLKQDNVIQNRRIFLGLLRLLGKDKKVTAGLYILKAPISTWGLVDRITNNSPDEISITLLDGWTFTQVRSYIDSLDNIQHLSLTMTESQLKSTLKINYPNLEGAFFPSTYFIAPNQSDLRIYQQAYQTMHNKLNILYANRESNTVYSSPYQLLIMASLIEKETNDLRDIYSVSAVFNNRLRVGMKLQDDPAVFYGLKDQIRVTRSDFQIDTPYNTYLHSGLPPTPICIPSFNALMAAAKPAAESGLLYFVAIGKGKTKFSTNYTQHKTAVTKYVKHIE